jgi:hypothetical protein
MVGSSTAARLNGNRPKSSTLWSLVAAALLKQPREFGRASCDEALPPSVTRRGASLPLRVECKLGTSGGVQACHFGWSASISGGLQVLHFGRSATACHCIKMAGCINGRSVASLAGAARSNPSITWGSIHRGLLRGFLTCWTGKVGDNDLDSNPKVLLRLVGKR